MSDGDRSVLIPMNANDPPEQLTTYEDFADTEEHPAANFTTGLVSLEFISAALRRSARLWCATAVAGFLIGLGLYVALPSPYQATTSVLLSPPPNQQAADSIMTDAALAQSRTVAGLAVHKLGLRQSVSSFLSTYMVTVVTDRVLLVTVSAPSSNDAVSRASALATEFLRFRAGQLETEQNLVLSSLDQQINQAKQHIKSITAQISQFSVQPASPSRQAKLKNLQNERSQATAALTSLEQTTNINQASTQAATISTLKGSGVLDAATLVPQSRLKHLLVYAATGLIAGLALGLGIVIVRALVSDRLRLRDDVAYALGAPVKVSVGTVHVSRWLPGRRGLAAAHSDEVQRIVAYLGNVIPPSSRGAAALAVVPIGDPRVAALALASLAWGWAEGFPDSQIVVADLCPGAPAGRLLGVKHPGVHEVCVSEVRLVVAVADRDDVVPVGPLGSGPGLAEPDSATEPLAAACASADVLLTLAALDPSLGGEHLATWATDAVVMVTAGRSSWTKIHAVGEMIRLAGARLVSAVLVGADKTDESLGVTYTSGADRSAGVAKGLASQ